MRSFLYSFYGKLSAVFLVLLILLGIAQVYITYQSSMQFVRAADQKLNMNLAKNMAGELEPFLKDSISASKLKSSIHYMMVFNPRIEIYVLDGNGKILAFFSDPPQQVKKQTVDLAPIHLFLSGRRNDLILGDDPRNPDNQKPFSASTLQIGSQKQGFLYIVLGSEQYDSALNMIQNSYIVQTSMKILIIILLVTAVVGLILFALLTRRLRTMTQTVENFEEGDLDARLADGSRDEIGQLARSYNRMAETIKTNLQELQKTDKLRRNLIANVSHDLRSPLASMQGYLETILLKEKSLSDEDRRQYLQTILNNTTMMRKLVEELFELSKLDAQQVEPKPEPFSIAELIQDVVLKLKPKADKKGIELKGELNTSLPPVYADIAHIERVLTNLIENAIRYTNDGHGVFIHLTQLKDKVQVTVEDTGSGIGEDDLPHIFDRFYRADKSRSKAGGNTGLGLAIAQKMATLNSSSIQVKSELNKGTRFYFSLPVS